MTRYRWTMCLPGRVVSKMTSLTFACVVLCSSVSRWQSWLIGGHSANRIRPAVIPALFCHCCSVYKRSADCGVLTDWSSVARVSRSEGLGRIWGERTKTDPEPPAGRVSCVLQCLGCQLGPSIIPDTVELAKLRAPPRGGMLPSQWEKPTGSLEVVGKPQGWLWSDCSPHLPSSQTMNPHILFLLKEVSLVSFLLTSYPMGFKFNVFF